MLHTNKIEKGSQAKDHFLDFDMGGQVPNPRQGAKDSKIIECDLPGS